MVSLIFLILSNANSLFWPFLMCFFANRTTDEIANTGYTAFESDWYDYPVDVQKYLVLIIARSQKPAFFDGLYFIDCTLESFGNVWHRQYSEISCTKYSNDVSNKNTLTDFLLLFYRSLKVPHLTTWYSGKCRHSKWWKFEKKEHQIPFSTIMIRSCSQIYVKLREFHFQFLLFHV